MVEGFSELVQASGISVPARARFVGRFLGYTTFGALTFGLVCGQLGVLIGLGPLIPFAWGSWFGYTLSSISFLRAEFATAREYVRDYPRLLEYVLRTEFSWAQLPQEISVDQWAEGSLPRLSWCVLASQSCQANCLWHFLLRARRSVFDFHFGQDQLIIGLKVVANRRNQPCFMWHLLISTFRTPNDARVELHGNRSSTPSRP
ncbi:unnamed protein product [Durusdinium trenchii]|uniref:Vesicle transport protein n=1 Tax=Durusdinium trenchii TaxID=1381693 RepID=A0ABP0QVY3_9DINO